MPRIFDNIENQLLPTLRETLRVSYRSDFCVGYFNLRGWKQLGQSIDTWSGTNEECCRLLVGMQRPPEEGIRTLMSVVSGGDTIDNQTALRLKKRLAEEFRTQLTVGTPTNQDEAGLRTLATQIRAGKVVVKLFLRYPLHAKLYLLFRHDHVNPIVGYLGSSNLTFAGLSHQGELNIDVLDHDACVKLKNWFEDRWNDRWCVDISQELVDIIDESWAREALIPPYHIYIKIAYHLSQEARAGLSEFQIPGDFGDTLFDFQKAAVKIAAHHLNKRGGVLIGDVVGLGKTLMATALARIFEDDYGLETLIICPPNLVSMWEDYRTQYRLRATVLSIGQVVTQLPNLRRHRVVLIDESHNLRNREGRRYAAIAQYIRDNDSKVIMLSATPYNKTYVDLSNQLRLFVPEDQDLGTRPERLLSELGETEFIRRHQAGVRTLAAFEKSPHADDWRDLMRLYLVRRTRSFIMDNYAGTDPQTDRKYLTLSNGSRSYFPVRVPKTVKFAIRDGDPSDQYARLYAPNVVDTIERLELPRYGLGNYKTANAERDANPAEKRILQDLSRAGKRLMGFARVGLFKRLESSGDIFIQSLERHILRNYIYLHAIEQGDPIPVGTQDIGLLDTRTSDEDVEAATLGMFDDEEDNADKGTEAQPRMQQPAREALRTVAHYKSRAQAAYREYRDNYPTRFKWLRPHLLRPSLAADLMKDSAALMEVLQRCEEWDPNKDAKLAALIDLLTNKHPQEKVLVFSQFADTVDYLVSRLNAAGIERVAGSTGDTADPTVLSWQFSPISNKKRDRIRPEAELRVMVATDVLSEGQNLQDCHIVVNYDLPWAIIRLIQRAGRVDRIGQVADEILAYTFLPAEGIERIIRLRERVRRRLRENADVVGTDEAFFEDDLDSATIINLYNEQGGLLDGDADGEVDLASYAYQIWKNAADADPSLLKKIPDLPNVVFATRPHQPTPKEPEGVLVYMRTPQGNDALAWVDKEGKTVTESQLAILRAAECAPETPALPRMEQHHALVERGLKLIAEEETSVGGQLGRPSGARFRVYERIKSFADRNRGTLWDTEDLRKAVDDIYRYPLRQPTIDTLNRQLKAGIGDHSLVELVLALRDEGHLCIITEEEQVQEPQIICSLGLVRL